MQKDTRRRRDICRFRKGEQDMEISIFDVIGPVMIGPSSSHTAGAARLARTARTIVAEPFHKVRFGLCGSFEKTYRGHGTDRALLAGALGLGTHDERLADALTLAKRAGLEWEFVPDEVEGAHENTVRMTFYTDSGAEREIIGSSIGGGRILITRVDGFEMSFDATAVTLLVQQYDRPGVIRDITRVLAENRINIAVMRLARRARGDLACTVIETDSAVDEAVVREIAGLDNIIHAQVIDCREEEM